MPIRQPLAGFPDSIGGWQGRQDSPLQTEIVSFLKIDDHLMRRYVCEVRDEHTCALFDLKGRGRRR